MRKILKLQEFVVARQAPPAMADQDAATADGEQQVDPSQATSKNKKKDGKKSTTDSGMPRNAIEINPQYNVNSSMYEAKERHVVVAPLNRFQGITTGHEKLVKHVQSLAKKVGGEPHVYLSRSHDKKKNPLDYKTKQDFAQKAFGDVIKDTPEGHSSVFHILSHLHNQGFTHAHIVAGEDRVKDYQRIADTYNGPGKDFNFKKITVHSAGQRDPDSDDVKGMSATKLRAHAATGDPEKFKSGLPKTLHPHAQEYMSALRHGMGLKEEMTPEELQEVLSVQARIKKASRARAMRGKLAMGRRRALNRKANRSTMAKRSQRVARRFLRARMLRGRKYSDLSYSGRAALDRTLKLKSKSVNKLATKLLPRLQQAEQRRKSGHGFRSVKGLGSVAGISGVKESLEALMRSQTQIHQSIANALKNKSEASNIPYDILETVYYRGLADHAAGHRETCTPQQWAFNRVNSYIHGGSTYREGDKDLAESVMALRASQRAAHRLIAKKKPTTVEEQQKVLGTNCMNCMWWKEDTEKPVGRDELNINGGLKAPNQHYIEMSKQVDLVSLPGRATSNVKAMCDHEDINDWVTERMCCSKWNASGTIRDYKGTSPLMAEEGGAGSIGTPELTNSYKDSTPGQGSNGKMSFRKFIGVVEAIEAPHDPARSVKLDISQAEKMRTASAQSWDMVQGHHLSKKFIGRDHNDVEMFVKAINNASVLMDHFPEIHNFYNEATVKITTKDVDGLTAIDFSLAAKIDSIAMEMGLRDSNE